MGNIDFPLKYTRPEIPIIHIEQFLKGGYSLSEIKEKTHEFAQLGLVCLYDPSVTPEMLQRFHDTMMMIHGASSEELALFDGADTGYQYGITPPGKEIPLDHSDWIQTLLPEHRPLTVAGVPDPKARFMWPIGTRPKKTRWPKVNASARPPKRFAHIASALNACGTAMHDSGLVLMQFVAMGLGLDRQQIVKMMKHGPHIMGPTGTDLSKGYLGKVLAGVHYDLSLITVHSKSNIRALICWTRNGQPFLVEVPDGCLLVQAGKSLEWITGGFFYAGKHEVLITPEALEDTQRILSQGGVPLRVSKNLFMHLATRCVMRPLGRFANPATLKKYPPIYGGDYETIELAQIGLFSEADLVGTDRIPPQYRLMMEKLRHT